MSTYASFLLAVDDFVDFLGGILFSRFDHSGISHPEPAFIRGNNMPSLTLSRAEARVLCAAREPPRLRREGRRLIMASKTCNGDVVGIVLLLRKVFWRFGVNFRLDGPVVSGRVSRRSVPAACEGVGP